MNLKKFKPMFRGLAATTATLLALSSAGYTIALSPLAIGYVDGAFGITTRDIFEEKKELFQPIPGAADYVVSDYTKDYGTAEAYFESLKAHTIKQGEEGFALMKNDNNALPLKANANVAVFGYAAYNHSGGKSGSVAHTGVTANNADNITLAAGLTAAGLNVNTTIVAGDFTGKTAKATTNYKVAEVFEAKDTWVIDKATTTGIVLLSRGGGEGANYMTDTAQNAEDPLALSDEEQEMIQYAKANCSKVVVLVETANAMELGLISKGGDLEVDAIGFCGIPNSYQYQGIANVLAGKVNATGGMSDTFAYDNSYNPAVINMGQQKYADANIVTDTTTRPDPLGRTGISYLHSNYIVEAEGVYVGYKYYESRYYDAMVDPEGTNATDKIGSSTGNAWNYKNEVLYTFGHGLSYIPYSQKVTDVDVTLFETGKVVATVEVTNEGNEDGYFLAQLYVNKPYTDYDKTNKVEKSAIDFLSSAKVKVAAGKTETVEIEVPTKYLASWDSTALNGEGTYILDEGDYYFTAAAGAHEAVNNVLKAQGYETDGTTDGACETVVWNELEALDDETFATANGYDVRNQAENADINYWLPGTVTYLSRSDYKATFPKNYTNLENKSGIAPEAAFEIAKSPKVEEWIQELRNAQYVPKAAENEADYAKVEATLPKEVENGTFKTVWEYIMNVAKTNPIAFNNIQSDEWQAVAQAINLNVAVGNIINGGGSTDSWHGIDNPASTQSESVSGYEQNITVNGASKALNVASNTLLGSSFNPDLAYQWGLLEGEGGLWLMDQKVAGGTAITVWGAGLNQHRHPYNGRNSEYMSEDPMLTNRIGYGQFKGAMEKGAICGPKHMGFNDQEMNREGNCAYMTEQKMRETDIRCYEGALSDAHGSGVMMSFSRIGATNVTNHVGLQKHIMREEWGFTGIITTDMGKAGYHDISALIMATCNQLAGFGSNDARLGSSATDFSDEACKSGAAHSYLTLGVLRRDPVLAEQARQTSLYELYTIAHSASGVYARVGDGFEGPQWITTFEKVGEMEHAPWEYIFMAVIGVTAVLTAVAGVAYVASVVMPEKEEN